MFSHKHEVEMTRRYRKDHDLMGFEADDLISMFDTLTEEDIWQYRYPEFDKLKSVGVRGIYLGNFIRWDPKFQHEKMIKDFNYKSYYFSRTFDTYDFVDCFNYMNLHDLIKHYKHGYTKVHDHASKEIRFGRISKGQAIKLVERAENSKPKYLNLFCDWLGIDYGSLNFILNEHRNYLFWNKKNNNHFFKWNF